MNAPAPIGTRRPGYPADSPAHGRSCPRCNGSVYRVPRRFIDRCVSLCMPVHRYRCSAMGCQWEGNLRAKQRPRPGLALGGASEASIGAAEPAPLDHTRPSGPPPR